MKHHDNSRIDITRITITDKEYWIYSERSTAIVEIQFCASFEENKERKCTIMKNFKDLKCTNIKNFKNLKCNILF